MSIITASPQLNHPNHEERNYYSDMSLESKVYFPCNIRCDY